MGEEDGKKTSTIPYGSTHVPTSGGAHQYNKQQECQRKVRQNVRMSCLKWKLCPKGIAGFRNLEKNNLDYISNKHYISRSFSIPDICRSLSSARVHIVPLLQVTLDPN